MRTKHLFPAMLFLAAAVPATAQDSGEQVSWLYVLQGTVSSVDHREMRLSTAPDAVAFSERPERRVRLLPVDTLVEEGWGPDGDFTTDGPNASLVNEDQQTISVIDIVDARLEQDVLTLEYVLLEGEVPEAGDRVAITIDNMWFHPILPDRK